MTMALVGILFLSVEKSKVKLKNLKPKQEAKSSESVFKASVLMLKPWTDFWSKKPTVDEVLEAFADAIRSGEIDKPSPRNHRIFFYNLLTYIFICSSGYSFFHRN
jgi:hypothetical protein